MTTTAPGFYTDVILLHKLNIFPPHIYDILKNNIFICSCWGTIENGLLWRYAIRSSLPYSCCKYIIELPLQPYKIQMYTFWV